MLFMGFIFLVGLVMFTVGQLKKDKNNRIRKTGLIIAGIPTTIVVLMLLLSLIGEIFTSKPDNSDLVGKFQIVKVTQLDFDKSTFKNYHLQFHENGKFTLTPTPFIDVCKSGKFKINYDSYYNELSLECSAFYTTAHIDRGFGGYKIEFVIGDPDSGRSIFFEKVENE